EVMLTLENLIVEFTPVKSVVILRMRALLPVLDHRRTSNSVPAERQWSKPLPQEKLAKILFQFATNSARKLCHVATTVRRLVTSATVIPVSSLSPQNVAAA